jgi:hypothetical protein
VTKRPCRRALPLLLLSVLTASAMAQQPAPAPTAEAMERARRDAANPMRVILEAGRIQQKRRADAPATGAAPAAAPAPAPAAPAATTPRREAPRTLAAAEPAAQPVPATAPSPERTAPVVGESAPVPSVRPAEPEPAQVAAPSPIPEPVVVPELPLVRPAPADVLPVQTPTLPPARPIAEFTPTLVNMVEPAIPAAVRSRIGPLREVIADLSLRADGSVAGVELGRDTPRAAVRYLTQAFEQWRFAPLPEARVHRVQLVFAD